MELFIIEDDIVISDMLCQYLKQAGYQCTRAYDGIQAADLLQHRTFDLVLLDIMLPHINGYELMEMIRPMGIPVIFLSAKATVEERVMGLRLGADDYLPKPFEMTELLARIEAVMRRNHILGNEISLDDITIDIGSRVVTQCGREVLLTKKEFDLLLLFVQNRNTALYRDTIYERVWGEEYLGDSRTVDLHVQRLRKKLEWEDRLKAVYKIGYRLELDL